MAIFLGILQALAAIPALAGLFDQFSAWYVAQRISSMKAEDADAIRKAVVDHDQRAIENAIGSTKTGELSGAPGTIVINGPPGGLPK